MEEADSGSLGTANEDPFIEFEINVSEPPVRQGIVLPEEEKK